MGKSFNELVRHQADRLHYYGSGDTTAIPFDDLIYVFSGCQPLKRAGDLDACVFESGTAFTYPTARTTKFPGG